MQDRIATTSPMIRSLYYTLKPYLPWRLRVAIRRSVATRIRNASGEVWPIQQSSACMPGNWPGWPDGKGFAFVITHDVEGPGGVAKCRRLAELDQSLGFRSAFNFVPKGGYVIPKDLRQWLTELGFEVGIHDLHHDGKLYASREKFKRSAENINQFLSEWGSVGFRSGFMLHRCDWIHDLEIEYDSSTFDTDPFEPQSDGAGTIFPFWVSAIGGCESGKGYIELPYTLPQDSTLFLIFREKSPSIWLEKLDWVASHGGMALVNVHPDYIQFPGDAPSERTFPVEHYIGLLEHVRDRHAGACWQALPREVARAVAPYRPRHEVPLALGQSQTVPLRLSGQFPLTRMGPAA